MKNVEARLCGGRRAHSGRVAALCADSVGGIGARVALVHERRGRAQVEYERRLRRLHAAAAAGRH